VLKFTFDMDFSWGLEAAEAAGVERLAHHAGEVVGGAVLARARAGWTLVDRVLVLPDDLQRRSEDDVLVLDVRQLCVWRCLKCSRTGVMASSFPALA
jgi:hypothetical protein